jgi:hypothetical protein
LIHPSHRGWYAARIIGPGSVLRDRSRPESYEVLFDPDEDALDRTDEDRCTLQFLFLGTNFRKREFLDGRQLGNGAATVKAVPGQSYMENGVVEDKEGQDYEWDEHLDYGHWEATGWERLWDA